MSTVLAIDTASAELALALAIDGECVGSFATPAGHDHSRLLIPAIDAILGSRRAALTGVVVVHGHTPTGNFEPDANHCRINVDTGACFGGPLTAAVLAPGEGPRFLHA